MSNLIMTDEEIDLLATDLGKSILKALQGVREQQIETSAGVARSLVELANMAAMTADILKSIRTRIERLEEHVFSGKPLEIDLGTTSLEDASGRTAVLYGDSGNGKSTQLADAVENYFNQFPNPVCLISREDSSKNIFLPLIHAGLVQALFVSKIENPITVFRQLSRGFWPKGGLNKDKKQKQEWEPAPPFSGYMLEGMGSIASLLQEDNRENNRFLGEHAEKNNFLVDGERLSLPGQFSYGFVQAEIERLLNAFAMLPVQRVIWTSHEYKGSEEGTGKPIRGPQVVGKALTGSIGKHCGLLIHADVVGTAGGGREHRLHLTNHADPGAPINVNPAKITVPLSEHDRFFNLLGVSEKQGYVVSAYSGGRLKSSLAHILQADDQIQKELTEKYASRLTKS